MGFDLKKLGAKTGKARIEIFGEELNVEYQRNVITAQWSDELDTLVRGGANSNSLYRKTIELISGWDVENDGKPLALPTAEEIDAYEKAAKALDDAEGDKATKEAEKALDKQKESNFGILRAAFPLPFVGQLLQACARDMSVGGAGKQS